jgi:carboxyl-terminal processing protease
VYGGGGIMPDYIVKGDTIGMLARKLRAKNLYWAVADEIMRTRGKDLRATFGNDMSKFLRTFEIGTADIDRLKALAKDKEIEWDDKDYAHDDDFVRTVIKAYIGRAIYNNNGYTAVMLGIDNQAQKALTLFNEATKIAKLR